MEFDRAWIQKAEEAGAPEHFLEWVRKYRRTVDEMCQYRAFWALWCYRLDGWDKLITQEQFDHCVQEEPWAALGHVRDRLSKEQLAASVKAAPNWAGFYGLGSPV
jgi:hypothetical protein